MSICHCALRDIVVLRQLFLIDMIISHQTWKFFYVINTFQQFAFIFKCGNCTLFITTSNDIGQKFHNFFCLQCLLGFIFLKTYAYIRDLQDSRPDSKLAPRLAFYSLSSCWVQDFNSWLTKLGHKAMNKQISPILPNFVELHRKWWILKIIHKMLFTFISIKKYSNFYHLFIWP